MKRRVRREDFGGSQESPPSPSRAEEPFVAIKMKEITKRWNDKNMLLLETD